MSPKEAVLAGWQMSIVLFVLTIHTSFLHLGMNIKSALLGTSLLVVYAAVVSFLSLFIPDFTPNASSHRAAAIGALFTATLILSTETALLHSFYPAIAATVFFLLSIGLVAKYLEVRFKRMFWSSIAQGLAIYLSVKYGPLLAQQITRFS